MLFGLFKNPEVFNGYGLKRWDYKKPHVSIGMTNKVFLHSTFPYDGVCWFIHSMKNFPFRMSLCCGVLHNSKDKNGLYFQGSTKEPYERFKYLFFKRFFIGSTSPQWLIKRQQKKDEQLFLTMDAAYEQYVEANGLEERDRLEAEYINAKYGKVQSDENN